MSADSQLLARIDAATREEVLEAARFFSRKLAAGSPELAPTQALAADQFRQPFAHVEGLEKICRALLAAGARDPALASEVTRALDGAGRKQFILGGAEIVALAVVAVIALKVVITGGKGQTETKTRVVMHPDGRVDLSVEESERAITITGDLAALFGITPAKQSGG
jgi:hypothetical protein